MSKSTGRYLLCMNGGLPLMG
eukprot:COSAG03_NODE_9163_length_741_cov_1.817757_1_plen_20_part_10